MNGLIDYYEDEDKQMNNVLNKFFKDNYFLLSVYIIPNAYDRHKLYGKTMELQMAEERYFSCNKRLYEKKSVILNLLWMYVVD